MRVARRSRPNARQRHKVCQIQRVDDRLPDVRVNVTGQARKPRLDRVDALADASEAQSVDDALDGANLLLDAAPALIGEGDRRGEIAERNMIAAKRLQRQVGVDQLVIGVAVEKLGGLVVNHLAQYRRHRLALVEPLAPELGQRLGGVGLVERKESRHPAVAEILVIERVENPRPTDIRETEDGQRPQMFSAEHRFEAAGQRRVGKQPVEIHRRLGDCDVMAARRDRAVKKGQRLAVVERAHLRHETGKQVQRAVGFGDEAGERLPPVAALHIVTALDQRPARGVGLVGRRQERQRRMVAALEMRIGILERRAPLFVDQPRRRIGKVAARIAERLTTFGLEVKRPS